MNQVLQTSIYNTLKNAVSASTTHVYFLYLPSQELLDTLTVVYELNNTENEDLMDVKEATKFYDLRIKLNAPSSNSFADNSIYIKSNIYKMIGTVQKVSHIHLIDEEIFYDDDLNVFTEYLRFEIQYN